MNLFKNNYLSKRLIIIITFSGYALLLISMNSCSSSRNIISKEEKNQEWEIVKVDKKDVPTWTIFSRKLDGTNVYEYKIEGVIESNASASLLAFKENILDHAKGAKVDKKLMTYNLIEKSEESLLTYVIHKEPFIFKDTEMCVQYKFYFEENGNTKVKWNEAWKKCKIEPSKKLKRIKIFRGSWDFSSTLEKTTHAVNSVQFDPKGMPMWLVKPMVVKFLRKELENIREMTTK